MKELIFVYNADSGVLNLLKDAVHQVISPDTYPCNLCKLTTGFTGPKPEWQKFINNLSIRAVFLHKDEFNRLYNKEADFPCVFFKEDSKIKLIISNNEVNKAGSINELKKLIKKALSDL